MSLYTHFVPQKDYVVDVTAETYDSFLKKNNYRSIFFMFYSPRSQQSQVSLVQFLRSAFAFRVPTLIDLFP